jgi:hypothetical protein
MVCVYYVSSEFQVVHPSDLLFIYKEGKIILCIYQKEKKMFDFSDVAIPSTKGIGYHP